MYRKFSIILFYSFFILFFSLICACLFFISSATIVKLRLIQYFIPYFLLLSLVVFQHTKQNKIKWNRFLSVWSMSFWISPLPTLPPLLPSPYIQNEQLPSISIINDETDATQNFLLPLSPHNNLAELGHCCRCHFRYFVLLLLKHCFTSLYIK